MFERRLRIVLIVLVLLSMTLFGRVFGMQIFGHSYWTKQAAGLLTRPLLTETTRGRIFDFRNKLMAEDVACTDACVDYRAIMRPPDADWVKKLATDRVSKQLAADLKKMPRDKRTAAIAAEEETVNAQIQAMWVTLAARYHPTDIPADTDEPFDSGQAMDALRKGIVQTVEARRLSLMAQSRARADAKSAASSALVRWVFADGNSVASSVTDSMVIEEQQQPHVILHALDSDGCNYLGKHLEDFPGLVLRPSTHRFYPLHTVASHVLGRMSRASTPDMVRNKGLDKEDPRMLLPYDMVGRDGVEALCEPLLRGVRGKIEKQLNDGSVVNETPFQPGADVHLTIDSDLQAKVQEMLKHVEIEFKGQSTTPPGGVSMHASAVVLDVTTNEVRVLASNPGFDVNDLETKFAVLLRDRNDEPLRDRATCDELEPGSTVKPLLGLGAISQGILKPDETIKCEGALYLPEVGPDGRVYRKRMPGGRCWILSEYGPEFQAEGKKPEHGPLTFAGALERSCDIFFETVADRLGPDRVNFWYDQFGLGRPTGIGIFEQPGLRSGEFKGKLMTTPRMNNCLSGMGEGTAWATPLQIANEAATIARDGVWMRPRLLSADTQQALDAVHPRPSGAVPDSLPLNLTPEALRQAKIGMQAVVDGGAATGKIPHPSWLSVAAKTGTADTSPLFEKEVDAHGKTISSKKRVPVLRFGAETPTPWYRSETGKTEVIAWYMGYAPAVNPKIAFCVTVEYPGAGGGLAAGPIASKILDACASAGYFHAAAQ